MYIGEVRRGDGSATTLATAIALNEGRTPASWRRRAFLAFAAVLAAAVAATAPLGVAATPIGDRLGVAFFATMHRAYLHTPGVRLTVVSRGSTHAVFGHFLLKLRAGMVVAEEFVGSGGDPNRVVARRGGPTFAWQAGERCWRRLPRTDPRTLTDVGLPYPYPRAGAKAMAPRRKGSNLLLTTENPDKVWFLATQNAYGRSAKRIVTYTVDARSDHIRSIAIRAIKGGNKAIRSHVHRPAHWWTATVRVTTLAAAPHLPRAAPICK
ncbi:MAG: hypothetical protein WBB76_02765 [Gaiellaceae bacterium]